MWSKVYNLGSECFKSFQMGTIKIVRICVLGIYVKRKYGNEEWCILVLEAKLRSHSHCVLSKWIYNIRILLIFYLIQPCYRFHMASLRKICSSASVSLFCSAFCYKNQPLACYSCQIIVNNNKSSRLGDNVILKYVCKDLSFMYSFR